MAALRGAHVRVKGRVNGVATLGQAVGLHLERGLVQAVLNRTAAGRDPATGVNHAVISRHRRHVSFSAVLPASPERREDSVDLSRRLIAEA
jgi:hypothetical protein